MQKYNSTIYINQKNIVENYKLIKSITQKSVICVVKADAYGFGIKKIFPLLYKTGCRTFAVAYASEAEKIIQISKKIGIQENISLLLLSEFSIKFYNAHPKVQVLPVVHCIEQMHSLGRNQNYTIYFDTGFTRLGAPFQQAKKIRNIIKQNNLLEPWMIISHFSNTENTTKSEYNNLQYKRFAEIASYFPTSLKSLFSSGSLFWEIGDYMDYIRIGKALYGLIDHPKIKNVITLEAKILQIQDIPPKTSIGYNQSFISKTSMRVATISAGYADGVPFQLSYKNSSAVQPHNYQHKCAIIYQEKIYKAPIVGQISMDTTVIDITDIPSNQVYVEQKVEILGENTKPLFQFADFINVSKYSLAMQNNPRCKRIYKS